MTCCFHKRKTTFTGLQQVALVLMGIKKWRKVFSEFNCLKNLSDEPADWKPNEACTLCKTNSDAEQQQLKKNDLETANVFTDHTDSNRASPSGETVSDEIEPNQTALSKFASGLSLDQQQLSNQLDSCNTNSSFASFLKLAGITTTPTMTNTDTNSLINDSEPPNSLNSLHSLSNLISTTESMAANQTNESNADLSNDKATNYMPSSVCQLNQLNDYTNSLNSKLSYPVLIDGDANDLDNASIKSETLNNESIADNQPEMTIDEPKPQFSSLASLLNSDLLNNQNSPNKPVSPVSLFEQMFIMSQASGQTTEQPLDLSLHPKKELDLHNINLLSSLNVNNNSLAGKLKKTTTTRGEGVKKRSYTEEELGKALQDIKSGRLGTRRAAALYKIPRSTLRNKVHKMNNLDGKKKSVQPNLPIGALSMGSLAETDRNSEVMLDKLTQSTSDQSSMNDSLKELVRKYIYSKESSNQSLLSNDFDGWQELKQKLETCKMINNLANLNTTANNSDLNGLNNSLLCSLLSNNNFIDNSSTKNSLLNEAFALQLLSPQNLENMVTGLKLQLYLIRQHQIITSSLNNEKSIPSPFEQAQTLNRDNFLTNVVLDESINSILSNNSDTSSAMKINDHLADNQVDLNHNDDTRISVEKFEKIINRENLEQQSNGENLLSDDSNQSVIALDENCRQDLNNLTAAQRPADLSGSMNSTTSSLNLTSNQFSLLNSLNLSTLQTLANPLCPLNPLNLADLAGGSLNNLNLNLNLNQPITDQNKQNKQSIDNDRPSSSSGTSSDSNRKRPKRGRYRNYNKSDLDLAVKAVQNGEMSVHRAGTLYGVPHSTLEYKVKERHLLRPSKRLKKQQTAALQAALQQQQQSTINGNGVAAIDGGSFMDSDENLNTAIKLKNALIGKPADTTSSQPFLQQALFQRPVASQANPIHSLSQPVLAVSDLAASNLIKRLQTKDNFPNKYL